MFRLEDFPEVHSAYEKYVEIMKSEPENATQLLKFCSKNNFNSVKYADVTQYIKIKKGESTESSKSNLSKYNNSQSSLSSSSSSLSSSSSSNSFKRHSVIVGSKHHQKTQIDLNDDSIVTLRKQANNDHYKHDSIVKLDEMILEHKNQTKNIENDNKKSKPWLRNKPNWPQVKASLDSKDVQELKSWLQSQGFDKFFEKLYECGIETLNDLRLLETENEIMELVSVNGINMGVVFRRKFIKSVLELNGIQLINNGNSNDINQKKSDFNDEQLMMRRGNNNDDNNNGNNSNNSNNSSPRRKKMNKDEEKILLDLVDSIRLHTIKLKKSREELAKIPTQTKKCMDEIANTFDKAAANLSSHRKVLETMLATISTDHTTKLSAQVEKLQSAAKKLLACQQDIQSKFRDTKPSIERESIIINAVIQVLNEIPKDDLESLDIIYTPNEIELNKFIEKYGNIVTTMTKTAKATKQ